MLEKEGGAPDNVLPPSFLILNQKSEVLLWDKVFLSFGSFSLLFAVKKKENERTGIKKKGRSAQEDKG